MADEQMGMQKDYLTELAPWTKLFTAFKVALDPKKLLLGGAGLFVMALGWYLLSVVFFAASREKPVWNKGPYVPAEYNGDENAAFNAFKLARRRWNLLYEMAGAPSEQYPLERIDAGDLAENLNDYTEIEREREDIANRTSRLSKLVGLEDKGGVLLIYVDDKTRPSLAVQAPDADEAAFRKAITDKKVEVRNLRFSGEGKNLVVRVGDYTVVPVNPSPEAVGQLRDYIEGARTLDSIRDEIKKNRRKERIADMAILLQDPPYKPYGRLRTMPWFEDRGPNPYLLVTGNAHGVDAQGKQQKLVWGDSSFFLWLTGQQIPVLLEPLVKFFRPIVYLFDPAAGLWNRIYLFLVILWSMATWAFFGGAITRIAAVQVARANERVSLAEAVKFVLSRYRSYLLAPLLPMVFLAFLAVILMVVGFVEIYTFAVLDPIIPLFWPIVLVVGLVMAVVLVGLIGWPLMYSTISAEGSDSFDAISRSYSYVYGAPWQYLWYSFLAVLYGAVLVFFIGLMGSLTVYLSKWAFSLPPAPESRENAYLFRWAPTSYGWRNLLLQKSPNAQPDTEIASNGRPVVILNFRPADKEKGTPNLANDIGSFLMMIWLSLLFLLIAGFSYSYFWTSSTIIYLLMRRRVDDTEMDEIHLEEEPEPSFPTPVSTPSPVVPTSEPKLVPPGPQMVETPQLRLPTAEPPPPPPLVTPEPPKEPTV